MSENPGRYVGVFIAPCGHSILIYTGLNELRTETSCSVCTGYRIHWEEDEE